MWVPPSQSPAPNVEPLAGPHKTTLAQSAERKALKLVVVGSSVTLGVSRGGPWRACERSDSEGAFFCFANCMQALKRNPHGDTPVIEPWASHVLSERDTTTPCAGWHDDLATRNQQCQARERDAFEAAVTLKLLQRAPVVRAYGE